jgi:hypothetical protein
MTSNGFGEVRAGRCNVTGEDGRFGESWGVIVFHRRRTSVYRRRDSAAGAGLDRECDGAMADTGI